MGRDGRISRAPFTDTNLYAESVIPAINDATSLTSMGRGGCALRAAGKITCWGTTAIGSAGDTQLDYVGFTP